jgi:exodeoxyribonuclease-3
MDEAAAPLKTGRRPGYARGPGGPVLVATWNVNSIAARQARLLAWLDRHRPDALCLQELKTTEDRFPFAEVEARGYHARVVGQKTYNGVAVLSREPAEVLARGLDDGVDDPQARLVAVRLGRVALLSVYVPNGGEMGSDKCRYKLAWLARLKAFLGRHFTPADEVAVCGDFNVAPDERDVERPGEWEPTVLYHPEMRAAFADLLAWGLLDTFRRHHAEGGLYSWWDYRLLGFPKNNGLRIDHVLATRPLAERSTEARIDRDERKGKQPSDHAPVLVRFGG